MPDKDRVQDQARKVGTGGGDYAEDSQTQRQHVDVHVGGESAENISKQRRDFRRLLEDVVSLRNGGPDLSEILSLKSRYPEYRDDIEGAIQAALIKNDILLHRRVRRIEGIMLLILAGIVCIMIVQLAQGG